MPASPSLSAPPDPRDARALEDWLEARAQVLSRKIERILKRIVRQVYDDFIASVEDTTLTAAGDPNIIDNIIPMWQMEIANITPDIEETYFSGGVSAYAIASERVEIPVGAAEGWTQVVNTQAAVYMGAAVNRLKDVGRTLWNDVSRTARKAIEQGLGRDELAAQLRTLSDRFAGFRADVIARTEVNAAYANGDFDGDLALGPYGPVEKVWRTTMDGRERDSHRDANRQVRAFAEPFSVGGTSMMYPHAPGAPASQVVNCRCHYEPLYVGDARPDGSIVGEMAIEDAVQTDQVLSIPQPLRSFDQLASESADIVRAATDAGHQVFGQEDLILRELAKRQGFDALPTVVDSDTFDAIVDEQGLMRIYRGVQYGPEGPDQFVRQFLEGDLYGGKGTYGNGTYASTSRDTALSYAGRLESGVMDLAIKPGARLIDYADIDGLFMDEIRAINTTFEQAEDAIRAFVGRERAARNIGELIDLVPDDLRDEYLRARSMVELIRNDFGRFLTMKGYDGIVISRGFGFTTGENFVVVLNRGSLIARAPR